MLKIVGDLRSLLLSLWLGAACFFSFAVAPSAFAVIAERDLAGLVVSRTLFIINISGLIISVLLLLTSFLPSRQAIPFALLVERFLLSVLIAATAVGQFMIAFWMSQIRTVVGQAIESLAEDDPNRIQFNRLHEYSVYVLGTGMIAALLTFFILSYRARHTKTLETKTTSKNPLDF